MSVAAWLCALPISSPCLGRCLTPAPGENRRSPDRVSGPKVGSGAAMASAIAETVKAAGETRVHTDDGETWLVSPPPFTASKVDG